MKTWILNFLATRIGAMVAPLILTAMAGVVATVAAKVPWLAPLVTPENFLIFVTSLLAAGMSLVNYLTTARAFKYAEPVQRFINVIADKLGVRLIAEDGVVAGVTAAKADEIAAKLTVPGGPFNPNAEVKKAKPISRPGGGNFKGHVLDVALPLIGLVVVFGLAAVSILMMGGCAQMDSSVRAGMPVFNKSGYVVLKNYKKKEILMWERQLTYREAKDAGYNFWERNWDQPMLFPFSLVDGLMQFDGKRLYPVSRDNDLSKTQAWREAQRQVGGSGAAIPDATPKPKPVKDDPNDVYLKIRDGAQVVPDIIAEQPDLRASAPPREMQPVLRVIPVEDHRPMVVRLLGSVKPSVDVTWRWDAEDGIQLTDVTPDVQRLWLKWEAAF